MSQLALEWVPQGQHTADDLEFILEADEKQPLLERIPLLNVNHALHNGKMQLFRLKPGPGIILTEVREAYGTKRLSLLRGAGRIAKQMPEVIRLLDEARREWGCECIETVVWSAGLKRILERSGCAVEGYVMRYASEAGDGQ